MKRAAHSALELREQLLHQILSEERLRDRAWRREIAFWDEWLATQGSTWPADFDQRTSPDAILVDSFVAETIDRLQVEQVSVLDVGAGPLTALGRYHGSVELAVTAVDPLAEEYAQLIQKHGIQPRVVTQRGEAERLVDLFPPSTFDIAYARNALDHANDAALGLIQMFGVVREGGFVLLRHHPNEAETRKFRDLHRWSFDARGGQVVLKSKDSEIDVCALLGRGAKIDWRIEEDDSSPEPTTWLLCRIQKKLNE